MGFIPHLENGMVGGLVWVINKMTGEGGVEKIYERWDDPRVPVPERFQFEEPKITKSFMELVGLDDPRIRWI